MALRWAATQGFPCCVCIPCVHAVATTPAQRRTALPCSIRSVVSAFPETVVGSACASSFSRLAQRLLALRPAHSRCHHILWHASPKASAASLPPRLLRLLPAGALHRAGLAPAGTTLPYHGAHPQQTLQSSFTEPSEAKHPSDTSPGPVVHGSSGGMFFIRAKNSKCKVGFTGRYFTSVRVGSVPRKFSAFQFLGGLTGRCIKPPPQFGIRVQRNISYQILNQQNAYIVTLTTGIGRFQSFG